jgi:hypothetical protein
VTIPLTRVNSILKAAFQKLTSLGPLTKFVAIATVVVAAAAPAVNLVLIDKDQKAPIDFGDGPGKPAIPKPKLKRGDVPAHPPRVMSGPKAGNAGGAPNASSVPPKASATGYFGAAFAWPIIPLRMALLPDGRVSPTKMAIRVRNC